MYPNAIGKHITYDFAYTYVENESITNGKRVASV
jgi:hypothetical protein